MNTKTRKYFLILVFLEKEPGSGHNSVRWSSYKEVLLEADSLQSAKIEAKALWIQHREQQCVSVKRNYIDAFSKSIIEAFPQRMRIVEKNEYSIKV